MSSGQSEDGLAQPLLQSSTDKNGEDDDDAELESTEDAEDSNKPAKSFIEAYKLLTIPVKVVPFRFVIVNICVTPVNFVP